MLRGCGRVREGSSRIAGREGWNGDLGVIRRRPVLSRSAYFLAELGDLGGRDDLAIAECGVAGVIVVVVPNSAG